MSTKTKTKTKTYTRAQVTQAALEQQRGYLETTLRLEAEGHGCRPVQYFFCPMHQEMLELLVELLEREVAAE